jgi:large subunit ribosomal protein L30
MARIRVTQVRSLIGRPADQRDTVRRLGLRKIGHSVVHDDSPAVLGMAFKVRHLVEVAPAPEGEATSAELRGRRADAGPTSGDKEGSES